MHAYSHFLPNDCSKRCLNHSTASSHFNNLALPNPHSHTACYTKCVNWKDQAVYEDEQCHMLTSSKQLWVEDLFVKILFNGP